jgi:hypothetical protein
MKNVEYPSSLRKRNEIWVLDRNLPTVSQMQDRWNKWAGVHQFANLFDCHFKYPTLSGSLPQGAEIPLLFEHFVQHYRLSVVHIRGIR